MILAVVLAVTLSITVVAGGTRDACEIGNITHKVGDTNLDNVVNSGDITAKIKVINGLNVDLRVTSDGCCNVTVSWTAGGGGGGTVAAGTSVVFYNVDSEATVNLSADDSEASCLFGSWDGGVANPASATTTIDMEQFTDKCVTANCFKAHPEPCCWCIYHSQWWEGLEEPEWGVDLPDNQEYLAWHCTGYLPAGHTEVVDLMYDPWTWSVVIPVPTFHQELTFYGGPEDNGYAEGEWELLPSAKRYNPDLMDVDAYTMEYWIDKANRINWKTRYLIHYLLGDLDIYSWTMNVIPMAGPNAGWPYAVGNGWSTVIMSAITAPTVYFATVTAEEMIDCEWSGTPDIFPGGVMAYKIENNIWVDANENNIPEPGELTPSGASWATNQHPCPVYVETKPGQLYEGWENRCLIWICQDPPFPPWGEE